MAVNLSVLSNQVNPSMGLPDIYPFVLSETAHRKLACVQD
ncbi:putative zinc-binding metallopeptidase [Vreelandella aquamarina]